ICFSYVLQSLVYAFGGLHPFCVYALLPLFCVPLKLWLFYRQLLFFAFLVVLLVAVHAQILLAKCCLFALCFYLCLFCCLKHFVLLLHEPNELLLVFLRYRLYAFQAL